MARWTWLTLLLVFAGCTCSSREEKLKKAEEQGNLLAATKAKMVQGVGEALKNEGSQAAQTVTEGAGEVVKAVGKGFEKSLLDVKLTVADDLGAKGLKATRAARAPEGSSQNTVSVYVTLEKPFSGSLELRVIGRGGAEVGRASAQLDEKKPTARYLDFEFDPRTPLLTAERFELR